MNPQTYGAPAPGAAGAAGGPIGQVRNPIMVMLVGYICFLYGLMQMRAIDGELNKFLGRNQDGSILWFLFPLLPLLSMPKLMAEARAKAGTATQGNGSLIMYLLFGYFFITKDANEVWEKLGAKPG
jgi:hypothetical protein